MDMEKPMYLVTEQGFLIGVCSNGVAGWRFIPNNAVRKPGRKAYTSAVKCIPAWAFNMSHDLLTVDEWKARYVEVK